jgi:Holliday junction resolvasome RuvABC endonuclease subunit
MKRKSLTEPEKCGIIEEIKKGIIYAIDPGTYACGYSVLNTTTNILSAGTIKPKSSAKPIERLVFVAGELKRLMREAAPTHVVMETYYPFQGRGKNPNAIPQLRGVILEYAYSELGITPIEINASHARKIALGKGCDKETAHALLKRTKWYKDIPNRKELGPDALDAIVLAAAVFKERIK